MQSEVTPQTLAHSDAYALAALDRWSARFTELLVPSGLGRKVIVTECVDEGAKVLTIGLYLARRTAQAVTAPYNGAPFDGPTLKDQATGSLWAYPADVPGGFHPQGGERFLISLGRVMKCADCRGQGRVKCPSCGGRVRWSEKNLQGEMVVRSCSCGDGRVTCSDCTGYGEVFEALRVDTRYSFESKRAKHYGGRLPEERLMRSPGQPVFGYTADFTARALGAASDGFDAIDFERLMGEARAELGREIDRHSADKLLSPQAMHELVDGYFRGLANPVTASVRLEQETLPIRLTCEVLDVPVKRVSYRYKDKSYVAYVHGANAKVWPDGAKPSEVTWKALTFLALFALMLAVLVFAGLSTG